MKKNKFILLTICSLLMLFVKIGFVQAAEGDTRILNCYYTTKNSKEILDLTLNCKINSEGREECDRWYYDLKNFEGLSHVEGLDIYFEDYSLDGYKGKECKEDILVVLMDDSYNEVFINMFLKNSNSKFYSKKYSCGSGEGRVTGIPKKIPELTSMAMTIIQIAVPIILIILGSIDLFKGITAGKEDEMKKGQQMFIKRLIVGAVIFFVVIIVKFLISIIADTNVANIVDCIDCFVNNECNNKITIYEYEKK